MIRLALFLLIACAGMAHAVDDPIAKWTFDASNGADADERDGVARTGVYFYRLEATGLDGTASRTTRVALIH